MGLAWVLVKANVKGIGRGDASGEESRGRRGWRRRGQVGEHDYFVLITVIICRDSYNSKVVEQRGVDPGLPGIDSEDIVKVEKLKFSWCDAWLLLHFVHAPLYHFSFPEKSKKGAP